MNETHATQRSSMTDRLALEVSGHGVRRWDGIDDFTLS